MKLPEVGDLYQIKEGVRASHLEHFKFLIWKVQDGQIMVRWTDGVLTMNVHWEDWAPLVEQL